MSEEFDSSRPIYTQIVERMQRRVVSGEYPPGSRLPSVRDLAGTAGVNPNTMQRALAELERQGLVRAERTAGRFVTDDIDCINVVRLSSAQATVERFLTEMRQLGYGPDRAAHLVETMAQATLPEEIRKRLSKKRRAGDADAAVDPLSQPDVKAALARASFELLVGFQLTDQQLAYNVTR